MRDRSIGSRRVLFKAISSWVHHIIVAPINLLLFQITVPHQTVYMQSCYASIGILSRKRNPHTVVTVAYHSWKADSTENDKYENDCSPTLDCT